MSSRAARRMNADFDRLYADLVNPAEGGFSTDPHTGKGPGGDGVMVARPDLPGIKGKAMDVATPNKLRQFAVDNADTLGDGMYMGGWNSEVATKGAAGFSEVEHSEKISNWPPLNAPATIAARGEKAGFNLATGDDIKNYDYHQASSPEQQSGMFKLRANRFLSGLE